MDLTPTYNGREGLNIITSRTRQQSSQAMISAVADSCSVRLDKVNRKVYKFHALVFNPDSQGNNKEAYFNREKCRKTEATQAPITRSILSQQPKTEWKCAYNELLSSAKDLQQKDDNLSDPISRKRSKTSLDNSSDCESSRKERQRVRFKETEALSSEAETCPTCRQVIAEDAKDYDSLMETSKEELVAMVMNLQNRNRRRKNGHSPTDNDIAQLMQLDISNHSEQTTTPKTKPTRTRRKLSRNNRLASI